MESILLRTPADGYTSVYPSMQVLVGGGASIVIVTGIDRLYTRIRLKRKGSNYI